MVPSLCSCCLFLMSPWAVWSSEVASYKGTCSESRHRSPSLPSRSFQATLVLSTMESIQMRHRTKSTVLLSH